MRPVTEPTPKKSAPAPGPYLFTLILLAVGLWFAYDGWLNPEIESVLFNRILAPLFLLAALLDGLNTRRKLARRAAADAATDTDSAGGEAAP